MKQDTSKPAQPEINVTMDREKYLLTRRKEVIQTLRMLAKEKTMISAYFGAGKYSLPTLVLDILPKKDLLIMDYGPNDAINKKFLAAERITFATSYHGIKAQFSVQEVGRSKYKGLPVYAVPIPDALLWYQRREFYRIKMPMENPAHCRILMNGAESIAVKLLDISAIGIAFMDEKCHFVEHTEEDNQLENCRLVLPGSGELNVSLDIIYRLLLKEEDASAGQRIGCKLIELNYADESKIQQYILSVERKRRQISKT